MIYHIYPKIYDRGIPAHQWLADYTATYIQRDVRQVINIGDLQVFSGFLKLCASRTGQEVNLSKLGSDAGVSHNTVRSWLSVLEASYILFRLPAWFSNIRKQIVETPKLHFFDSGLVCYLLGIREPEQLFYHPLRGAIFESWDVSEIYKSCVHNGMRPNLFHYREARGPEIDLLIEQGRDLSAVEINSGATVSGSFLTNLRKFSDRVKNTGRSHSVHRYIVVGRESSQKRSSAEILSWRQVNRVVSHLIT